MTVSYTPTSWVDGSTGLSAARLNNIESGVSTMAGSINRSATFTVAASNSSTADKAVADYLCPGLNDDVTINNAITAANGAQGGVVQLCAGTYVGGTTGIQAKSNVWLKGTGTGATTYQIANNVVSTAKAVFNNTGGAVANFVISDISINCNKGNNTQTTHGIYLTNVTSGLIISNVYVYSAKNGIGIWTDTNVDGAFITGCRAYSCDQDNIQINGTRIRIIGCYSYGAGSGYSGINIAAGQYNIVSTNNLTANSIGVAIASNNNTISANNVDSCTIAGIYVTGLYNDITGNTCNVNSGAGISVTGNATNIVGNKCSNNGLHGIVLSGTAGDCTIIGNNCQANGTSVNDTYNNITLAGGDYNQAQANTCRTGTNPNKPRYGIRISSGTANMVTNNNLHAAGDLGNISDAGTGTITAAGNYTT